MFPGTKRNCTGIEGNSKNATGAKDDDDADSVDSLASGGIDCDECDM